MAAPSAPSEPPGVLDRAEVAEAWHAISAAVIQENRVWETASATGYLETADSLAADLAAGSSVSAAWSRIKPRFDALLAELDYYVGLLFDRPLEDAERKAAVTAAADAAAVSARLELGPAPRLLRDIEDRLDQRDLGRSDGAELAGLLEGLGSAVAAIVADVLAAAPLGHQVVVVGPRSEAVDELTWVASASGLYVFHREVAGHDDGAEPVGVLVCGAGLDRHEIQSLLEAAAVELVGLPRILVADRLDTVDRLELSLDAHTVLAEVPPRAAVDELLGALARVEIEETVAVWGRDPGAVTVAASELRRADIAVTETTGVGAVLELARSESVRGVLLVCEADDTATELGLVHALRADPSARAAAVVVAGTARERDRRDLLRAGADDVIANRSGSNLIVTVRGRLRRRTWLEAPAERGKGFRALDWGSASILLDRLLLGAMRQDGTVGIGLLRMPLLQRGERSVDDLVARQFRQDDVISRVDEEHLLIGLGGANRATVARRLEDAMRRLELGEIGVRGVAVEFPIDGRSRQSLVERGRTRLAAIESAGGPVVAPADWQPEELNPPDLVIVDPDVALGAVLVGGFAQRGVRAVHVADAFEALERLTDRRDAALPRVVLIELDLVGMDGLQFLRELANAGTLDRFQVLVVSARVRESDIRSALDGGAVDVRRKPVSLPLLLSQVDRLLGTPS